MNCNRRGRERHLEKFHLFRMVFRERREYFLLPTGESNQDRIAQTDTEEVGR
jgi:hypothetical protein